MGRFHFDTQNDLRIIPSAPVLAYFSFLDTETGLYYSDFRLLKGATDRLIEGPCPSPARQVGIGRCQPLVVAAQRSTRGVAWFRQLTEEICGIYDEVMRERASERSMSPWDTDGVTDASPPFPGPEQSVYVGLERLKKRPFIRHGSSVEEILDYWYTEDPLAEVVLADYGGILVVHEVLLLLRDPATGRFKSRFGATFADEDREWIVAEAKKLLAAGQQFKALRKRTP